MSGPLCSVVLDSWTAWLVLRRVVTKSVLSILEAQMDLSGTSTSFPTSPLSGHNKHTSTNTVNRNVTNAVTGAFLSSFSHASGPMTG